MTGVLRIELAIKRDESSVSTINVLLRNMNHSCAVVQQL